jgi:uracil-DNA glycosylase
MNQPNNNLADSPKMLSDPIACATRRAQLMEPHMSVLSQFVQKLRQQTPEGIIPDFDPWDGGVNAEVLYLLEAPGAKAGKTMFVSRNNPDETAKNLFELNIQTGIHRKKTLCWNAVPWYIGSGARIRPAKSTDLSAGLPALLTLLDLLPKLRAVVFLGRKATFAMSEIAQKRPDLALFLSPHPSPMYCNRSPENRQNILNVLLEVSTFLGKKYAQ